MTKQNVSRRRSTKIAAAALTLGMASPFAYTFLPDPLFNSAAHANPSTNASEEVDKPIYSPGQASQKGTISGSVKEIVETGIGFGNIQDSGRAIKGVKVYAQWYEGVNTQHSSPVYYTESDENGNFTIDMAPYTDAAGVTRTFRADASVGLLGDGEKSRDQLREKIRVWTELPEDKTDKYRLVHQPAAGIFPGFGAVTTPNTQGDGRWTRNRVTGMTIQYAQKDRLPQHLPKNKWAQNEGRNNNHGVYTGEVFWNLHVLQGALNHNTLSMKGRKDVVAPGLQIVASYLNDQAVTKIEEYAKDNFAGKTLRGKGWTPADEEGLQRWINEQVAKDPESWIAETVHTTTASDGTFKLYWKGLYGNNHTGTGGGINPPAEKLHKLAGSWDEGSWLNGNRNSKHVNMQWSYVSIYDKDGNELPDNVGALYPWSLGRWMGPHAGGGDAQYFGGEANKILHGDDVYANWNIALVPQALKFDVVDKNTTNNWAMVGEKVQTDTAGLPLTQDLDYYVEWVDKNGKVVKTCETHKADSATRIPSCEFEVPTDAETGDTFSARLKLADGNQDPADDLILAIDAFAVARNYLKYDEVEAKKDQEASSDPTFDNPASEAVEEKPSQAKFELGKLPEGVTEDQVSVNEKTGVVTFTPNAEQAGKTLSFPVVMRDEALQVPVLDENGDPVKDESGNPKTQGRIVARAAATFKVETTAESQQYQPDYVSKLVVPGQETKSSAFFTDRDGKDVTAPEGAKFAIGEGFAAPEGYVVEIDESTGELTVSFPDKSKLNKDTTEEFDVPVTVTYKDGSADDVKANFKLDTDGDGKPDVTDPDDDGDGIPDEDDSNPKVPNVNDHFEPEYEDGSGKPGSDVKIDAPSFTDKDGNPTEAPEGTKFTPGENAPEGVKVDDKTGEITVPVPEDATPGTKIEVPVVVTYPDGTKDEVEVTVTVTEKDNGLYEPAYDGGTGQPGEDVKIDEPTFKDKDGNDVTPPEGTTFGPGEDAPDGVKIDPNTGEITVTIPEDATPGDKITVPVEVTYPDGSKDNVDVTVTVEEPDAPEVEKPDWKDDKGKPGEKVEIPNTGGDVPEGTTVEVDGPGKAEIDENGNLVVDINEDAKPGDKVVVVVKDKDGNELDRVVVEVEQSEVPEEPEAKDNEKYEPEYDGGTGQPGDEVKIDKPEFKDGDNNTVTPPEGTTFGPGEGTPEGVTVNEDGSIDVTIPEDATPGTKIEVPVVVTYPDGSTDEVTVTVTVTEKDATPVTPAAPKENNPSLGASADDPASCDIPPYVTVEDTEGVEYKVTVDGKELTPAAEGKYVYEYGQTVKVEAFPTEGYTFPEGTQTTWTYTTKQNGVCEVPEVDKPDWKGDSGKPGDKVEIPNTGGDVPEGSTVETDGPGTAEIDEDGNLIVDIDEGAKPGDKVVVVVKDKDGNEIDRVVVEVEKPADDGKGKDSDKYQPEYPDTNVKPGDKVEIPLKPGKLPKGTTCEIDMSTVPAGWNVSMGKNCTLIVVPGKDAKPGDIANIEVDFTYPDGSKDTATAKVTVAQPDAPAPAPAPGKETPGNGGDLARTGAQVAGVAGIAAAMIAAGFGLAFMRRRRAGEEN